MTGFDVSPAASAAAQGIGVTLAVDLVQLLARSTVVVLCVFDDAQVDAVVAQIDAAFPGQPPDGGAVDPGIRLVINTATCSPSAVDAAATALGGRGIAFMELPFSGTSVQIGDGVALGLVGAEAGTLARNLPLVATLSPRHLHVGPPGSAVRAKLASNLILGLNRAALAEGLAFAEALGLDGIRFLELLRESPAYSRAVDTVGERMVRRDFTPQSRIAQHRKDLSLILAQATALAQDLPLAQAHAALLDRAIALGLADADNAAVIAALAPSGAGHATARHDVRRVL